jgi:uncharacterized protein YuzE
MTYQGRHRETERPGAVLPCNNFCHMSDSHAPDRKCIKMNVPPSVCYLRFVGTKAARTEYNGHHTARGEMVIFDLDADGRIVGIELVGEGKPCQDDPRT